MPKATASRRPARTTAHALTPPRSGVSRPALWRVMEIHKMLRAGGFPNCSSLAKAIEVTTKTIQRDVSFMRDQLGLPLEYDAVRHGFFYSEPVHEFPMLHLSRSDLVALFLARHALEPLRGTRLERMLAASFSKIAEACPGEVSIHWHELDAAFSVKAVGVMPADVAIFSDLLEAATRRREVAFSYHTLKGSKAEQRVVRPHHIGQIDHGWYLLAHDVKRQAMRTFALQRISGLEILKSTFARDPKFNAAAHLTGGFGVWSYENGTGASHDIRIRFDGYAARVVAERQWHPTQQIIALDEKGRTIEFRATLAGLEEILRWVLSWGSKAKVLSPPELQRLVNEELRQALG